MALLNEGQKTTSLRPLPKRFKHHALFSYAKGDAQYVHAVRDALPEGIKVFDYVKDPIWGKVLDKELVHKYKNEAPFCVVFISQFYLASDWTEKELAVVSRVAKEKPGYMLPVVLDGTIVPQIEGIGWLDRKLTPEELAERLVAKINEPPPQPWWFYLSMRVKVIIAAVLLALILFAKPAVEFFLPSRTEVKAVKVTEQAITATLINSGPKTATIVGQRLKFGALPIEDAELRLDKASAAIKPGEHGVKLSVLTLDAKCIDGHRPNNAEIETLLDRHTVTLVLDVRESDDAPGRSTPRTMAIPAARLQPFVREWVADNVDPDC